MSVFIVSIQNLKYKFALENQPMWKMKHLFENQGILTEFITPYNDLTEDRRIKRFVWKLLFSLSRKKGFSLLYLILLLLMGREIYHQVRISFHDFNSIFAYDSITAYAATIASHNRIPVYLMSRYVDKPWQDYIGVNALSNGSLGFYIVQKILPSLLKNCQFNVINVSSIAPNDVIPMFNMAG